jgi:uncharacterized protein YqfA (UPF0365 family)
MRQRSNRCDRVRVDLGMAPCVMPLDVLKLRGILERRVVPVQVTHPAVQSRVTGSNVTDVTLEVLHVNGIETDDCDETFFLARTVSKNWQQIQVRLCGSETHSLISTSVNWFPNQ